MEEWSHQIDTIIIIFFLAMVIATGSGFSSEKWFQNLHFSFFDLGI